MFGIATAVAFALIVARAELRFIPLDPGHDSYHYARMAHGFPDHHIWAPFRNRPLVPLIVALLPLPVTWGFATATSVLLGAATAGVHRFLTRWFTGRVVWFGVALFATAGVVTELVRMPFLVDAAVLAIAAWVFVWLAEDRWLPILVVMPLAVAAHDLTLALLVPIGLTAWRRNRVPDAAVTGVLAVGVWWVLHRTGWLITVNDRGNMLDAGWREEMVRWNAAKFGSVPGAVWAHLLASFGVAWVFAAAGIRRAPRLVRDGAWMLPLLLALTMTASNWGRLFLPAAPVIVAMACAALPGERRDAGSEVDAVKGSGVERDE